MSKKRNILIGAAVGVMLALILIAVFLAGIFVESRKGLRLFSFGENRRDRREFVPGKLNEHGVIGVIDSIGKNTIVVKDRTGALKTILVDDQTRIRQNRNSIKFTDLKVNDPVIVLGDPEQQEGAIKARVIRVISDQVKESTGSGRLPIFYRRFLNS